MLQLLYIAFFAGMDGCVSANNEPPRTDDVVMQEVSNEVSKPKEPEGDAFTDGDQQP